MTNSGLSKQAERAKKELDDISSIRDAQNTIDDLIAEVENKEEEVESLKELAVKQAERISELEGQIKDAESSIDR